MFSLIALIVAVVAVVWSYREKQQIKNIVERLGKLETEVIVLRRYSECSARKPTLSETISISEEKQG